MLKWFARLSRMRRSMGENKDSGIDKSVLRSFRLFYHDDTSQDFASEITGGANFHRPPSVEMLHAPKTMFSR